MSLRLHDTMQRQSAALHPTDGQTFRFYCCGPTVYGPAHIGNFRTFILQDILRRVLEVGGLTTLHVRNITDLDDKTIRDSQKAGLTLHAFTTGWTQQFHADCAALQCLPPHIEPGAVAHIPQQVDMIAALIEKGHAYQAPDSSVYFKISSYPNYGRLSRLQERELQSTTAVADDEYEKDTLADFALWKARKPEDGENHWPSPWGPGRPGWHLECSAMTRAYLGDTFDLHSGGVDLIFPHHENEIAQSECCTGHTFCHHWFHIAHLLVDNAKMSKSLGNLYTLADLQQRGYHPSAVRYVLAASHYRAPLNFTLPSLDAARTSLAKIAKQARTLQDLAGLTHAPSYADLLGTDPGPFASAWAALTDDLNTAEALGQTFITLKALKSATLTADSARAAYHGLHIILAALGLHLPEPEPETTDIPSAVRELAAARWAARTAKDWTQSDLLRAQLDTAGWLMKDGKTDYTLTPK